MRAIIAQCTEYPLLGIIGEGRVNVLKVNLMPDGVLERRSLALLEKT